MINEKEIAVNAITGFYSDTESLGRVLESVIDERDKAWNNEESGRDRITDS